MGGVTWKQEGDGLGRERGRFLAGYTTNGPFRKKRVGLLIFGVGDWVRFNQNLEGGGLAKN